jgi:hypothetical protein
VPVDAVPVDAVAVDTPAPAPSVPPTTSGDLPAHLAGTRLATGGAPDHPGPEAATDAPVMSDSPAEPSTDVA